MESGSNVNVSGGLANEAMNTSRSFSSEVPIPSGSIWFSKRDPGAPGAGQVRAVGRTIGDQFEGRIGPSRRAGIMVVLIVVAGDDAEDASRWNRDRETCVR